MALLTVKALKVKFIFSFCKRFVINVHKCACFISHAGYFFKPFVVIGPGGTYQPLPKSKVEAIVAPCSIDGADCG
jgi:hypothetical protein